VEYMDINLLPSFRKLNFHCVDFRALTIIR